jgi:hypothetical protein
MRASKPLRLGSIAAVMIVSTIVGPTIADAYTQEFNEYPYPHYSCNNIDPDFCTAWPLTSGGLSWTVDVFLDGSVDSEPEVSLKADLRNAFLQWNNIAARNPHLQETISTSNDEVTVDDTSYGWPEGVYAQTTLAAQSSGTHRLVHAYMSFNHGVSWNHSYDFSVTGPDPDSPIYHAHSRKVAVHELGHAEGMGHTGHSPAIMRNGPTTYWTVQADDRAGIIDVYGAYP